MVNGTLAPSFIHLPMHLLGLLVLLQGIEHFRKVIHAGMCLGILLAWRWGLEG